MRYWVVVAWVALSVTLVSFETDAREKRSAKDDPVTVQAREAFLAGTAAAKAGQWYEALVNFEKADELKSAPIVTFNIGFCQRSLGRYVRARQSFRKVLEDPRGVPAAQLEETRAALQHIENEALAHVKITLRPASASISIDGRPLVAFEGGEPGVLVAGMAPAGKGKPPPKPTFEVVMDPGGHLIQASRPGHQDVLVNKTFAAGSREELSLDLDVLPATLRVESDQPRAIVLLDDRDVGLAPIDIARPAGTYRVQVIKKGFVAYDSTVELTPGQKANLTARMVREGESLTDKWWFWGGAAAIVAGGVTATYFLTRPESQPPDYRGGSLDWVALPR